MSPLWRRRADAHAETVRATMRLLPDDGNVDRLLANLSEHRGRRVVVIDHPFDDQGTTGLWIALPDLDLIAVDTSAGPSRRVVIIAHEIAHMMLGHEGPHADLGSRVAPDLPPDVVARVLSRDTYDDAEELDAERVATVLAVEQLRRQREAELRATTTSARLR